MATLGGSLEGWVPGGCLTCQQVCDEAGHAQDGLMSPLSETPKISGSGTARAGPWPLGRPLKTQPSMSALCGAWCAWAPIINDEGSFIFAGSGPGEETWSLLCKGISPVQNAPSERFLFYLNELQRITRMPQAEGWRCSEYEPLGTGPAAAETLIKTQPQLSTSSADIFYPFNEAALVLGDRFRDVPA